MPLEGCCCFDLRTGAIIIGILELISSCSHILSYCRYLLDLDAIFSPHSPLQLFLQNPCNKECMQSSKQAVMIALLVFLVLDILSLTAASLLIEGIRKNKPDLMRFYLVKTAAIIGLLGVLTLLSVLMTFRSLSMLIFATLPVSICLVLTIYFFRVVNDYKKELLQRQSATFSRLEEDHSAFLVIMRSERLPSTTEKSESPYPPTQVACPTTEKSESPYPPTKVV